MINFDEFDIDETKQVLTDKDFQTFLYDNDIYYLFIDNLENEMYVPTTYYDSYWFSLETFCNDIQKTTENRGDYILYAFDWESTKQGHEFWDNYSTMWNAYIAEKMFDSF